MPQGKYMVASLRWAGTSPWHGGKFYVNLLTPGVTEKFLAITMDAYTRNIGEQFGKRVPGVFTDEPEITPAGGLPWADDLPEVFQKRWNYDLIVNLPSLVAAGGRLEAGPARLSSGPARTVHRPLGQALPRLLRQARPRIHRPLLGARVAELPHRRPTTWRCTPGTRGPRSTS